MKKKKSQWTKKPCKKGWYWVRYCGATEVKSAGYFDKPRELFNFHNEDIPLERLWHCEFNPLELPK